MELNRLIGGIAQGTRMLPPSSSSMSLRSMAHNIQGLDVQHSAAKRKDSDVDLLETTAALESLFWLHAKVIP